jgi:hypothetical protein
MDPSTNLEPDDDTLTDGVTSRFTDLSAYAITDSLTNCSTDTGTS